VVHAWGGVGMGRGKGTGGKGAVAREAVPSRVGVVRLGQQDGDHIVL
jgi:hypothetical protein